MSLKAIVAALGGDLYHGGQRANIPAPGHSAGDRSVSLLLSGGRVVIHGFGGVDWRTARDDLMRRGLIDHAGRPAGGSGVAAAPGMDCRPKPDRRVRLDTAMRLWEAGRAITPADAAGRYLRRRRTPTGFEAMDLLHHPAAPTSVYRAEGRSRPALMAAIRDPAGRLTAVELTYLHASGRPALELRVPRKTVGTVPAGAAVRLAPAAERMLVAEGVVTTLSAVHRFGLPGWALLAANNLAAWTPPPMVRHVVIAADRGRVGEAAAARLRRRLAARRVEAEVVTPEPPFDDWNDVAVATEAKRPEGGRSRAPERRG